MKKWLDKRDISWRYVAISSDFKLMLDNIYTRRKLYFKSLIFAFVLFILEVFFEFFKRIKGSEITKHPSFTMICIIAAIVIYIFIIIGLYFLIINPIRKDLKRDTVICFDVTIISKHMYPHVDKYYVFTDVYPYNQIKVTFLEFQTLQIGASIPIYITEFAKHRFNNWADFDLM